LPQLGKNSGAERMSICSTAGPRDLPASLKPFAVTIHTAQELIGIKNTKIWELIRNGALETISVGKRRLVLFASIERLIAHLQEAETSHPRSPQMDKAIAASVASRRRKTRRAGGSP
jgi:hypothetical protein